MRKDIIFKTIEDKTFVWISDKNEYLVLENITADILKELNNNVNIEILTENLSKKISVPKGVCRDFIFKLEKHLKDNKNSFIKSSNPINKEVIHSKHFKFIKYYKINSLIFKVEFSNEFELSLIHPKFSHLEIDNEDYNHNFKIYNQENRTYLLKDNILIDSWKMNEIHFFQGKFSMEITQIIHQKKESEWLGVFHASAVSNNKKTILILGDSGYGKSTSLAILQANGFNCVADDFVPVCAKKQKIYNFPASISVKKSSLEFLLPIYPELVSSAEYNFKRLNKIVRYLPPKKINYKQQLPCKDLIFIRYNQKIDFNFSKINKDIAFKQLVPDSWLSREKENVQSFLDWFSNTNCYRIDYSNNKKMIQTITNIFNNE